MKLLQTALQYKQKAGKNEKAPMQQADHEVLSLDDAKGYVQAKIVEYEQAQLLLPLAMAGDRMAALRIEKLIIQILTENNKSVDGMDFSSAAKEIYAANWGLGPVEPYYRNPEVDEIRVNSPKHVYIQRRGKNERTNVFFDNEEHVERVIKRMFIEDAGTSLDRSHPIVMSVRKDGSRLTATCPPVSMHWTFVLRKPNTFKMTVENLKNAGTLDDKTWLALTALAKGRANILFSGNPGAGKSSLLRRLVGELPVHLRILAIGEDLELHLSEYYPDRDIIELEEHKYVGATMKELFRTALRENPDVVIIEEFRGAGEAIEAIKACTRGLPGSMATAHFNSPEEAVEGTALMMIEEGLPLPFELAKLRVARAFDIVVQMFGDTGRGMKKVVSVTEIVVDEHKIIFNELIRWQPDNEHDYMGSGEWVFTGKPSPELLARLRRGVKKEVLQELGWD